MTSGKAGTGAYGGFSKGLDKKQIAIRVDRHTVDEMYRMLREEGMTLQEMLNMLVERYVKSDPRMRALIEAYRRDNTIAPSEAPRLRFSKRERDDLLGDLERISPIEEGE